MLHEVVVANERLVARRLVVQVLLLGGCGFALVRLDGGWWWAALVGLLFLLTGAAHSIYFLAHWSVRLLAGPWRLLGHPLHRLRHQREGQDMMLLRLNAPLDLSGPNARAIALATEAAAASFAPGALPTARCRLINWALPARAKTPARVTAAVR